MENTLKHTVLIKTFLFDLAVLIFLGIKPLHIFLIGNVAKRGFFCNDDSISYPYTPTSAIRGILIFIGETTFTAIVIFVCEIYLHYTSIYKFSIAGFKLPICIFYAYSAVTGFLFGAALTRFMTYWLKYKSGELRPHFMNACRPNVDCLDPKNLHVYHTNYTCTNEEYDNNTELWQSFPCGQVATSIYCMLYLCIYIQFKMTWRRSKFFKHALQFVVISLSFYIGLSNYVINDHHPLDILSGLVEGAIFAILTALSLGQFKFNEILEADYQQILP